MMYDSEWFDARLYVGPGQQSTPDVIITFQGLRADLAEQALVAMVQQLANIMGDSVRVNIPDGGPPRPPQTISPATVQ